MTIEIANALFRYFETLYNLNRNVVALCGSNVFDQMSEVERRVDEVVMSIPRLIPYSFNKKILDYEISATDGLMVFSNDLPFLSTDYENIFQKHKGCLVKAKKIRNKLEHEMHGAHIVSSGSGTITMFSVTYKVYEEDIDLCAIEIIDFVKDMNTLFSKLQELLKKSELQREYSDHPYYMRLTRCDFSDFNEIFESNLLIIYGKTLLPF